MLSYITYQKGTAINGQLFIRTVLIPYHQPKLAGFMKTNSSMDNPSGTGLD